MKEQCGERDEGVLLVSDNHVDVQRDYRNLPYHIEKTGAP
jgi:hypothetical protein